MPKHKKPPRNAYFFFMVDKKAELERKGYRFLGGMKDVASNETVQREWATLQPTQRAKYEQMAKAAKEENKTNMDNKFTTTGESYTQVQARQEAALRESNFIEHLVSKVTRNDDGLLSRHFVVFRARHSCRTTDSDPKNEKIEYWPLEFSIASFSLENGLNKNHSSLVDTLKVPMGYASEAKSTSQMTALPQPGSSQFLTPHRDYFALLKSLRRFIQTFCEKTEGVYPLFIAVTSGDIEEDEGASEGCLRWLVSNAKYESRDQREEYEDFLHEIRFIRVTQLLLKLAKATRERNANYDAPIAKFGHLEEVAKSVLNKGTYDYKPNLTCAFHNTEEAQEKMVRCTRNIVLRTVFLILLEICKPIGIEERLPGHNYSTVQQPPPYGTGQSFVPPPTSTDHSPFLASGSSNYGRAPQISDANEFPSLGGGGGPSRLAAAWNSK